MSKFSKAVCLTAFTIQQFEELWRITRTQVTDDQHREAVARFQFHEVEEIIQDEGGLFVFDEVIENVAGVGYEYDEDEGVWWFTFTPQWLKDEVQK